MTSAGSGHSAPARSAPRFAQLTARRPAALAIRFLIDDGTVLAELAARSRSLGRPHHPRAPSALPRAGGCGWDRRHEPATRHIPDAHVHVVNHVDARIELPVTDARVSGMFLKPSRGLIAYEIVDHAGQRFFALALHVAAGRSGKPRLHAPGARSIRRGPRANVNAGAGGVHDEFRRSGLLAAVWLKSDRQACGRRQGRTQEQTTTCFA